MDLNEIAKLIARKMKNRSSFSNKIFDESIKEYTNLSEAEIAEVRKIAKKIFERDYSQGMGW